MQFLVEIEGLPLYGPAVLLKRDWVGFWSLLQTDLGTGAGASLYPETHGGPLNELPDACFAGGKCLEGFPWSCLSCTCVLQH